MQISKRLSFLLFLLLSIFIVSCQKSDESKTAAAPLDETLILKVTKENFISGKKFCQLYVNTQEKLKQENGLWIKVPKDYDHPAETISIYAYTRKPFNPNLPSYIFVDGGPGQNTHQIEDLLGEGYNQINFDQRGVGCSTPDTWEEYSDHRLYSSKNTVRDMEAIRKAYGINEWSIYGVSYGTIPATMYSSKYKEQTKSLIIEGVVGSVEKLARFGYSAEKWNLILKSFNNKQKESFDTLLFNDKEKKFEIIMQYFMRAGYLDAGFKRLREDLLNKLFPAEGGFNEVFYNELKQFDKANRNKYSTPQQPGAVDDNILSIFYCKELKAFEKDKYTLDYSTDLGFYERPTTSKTSWKDTCYQYGIKETDQDEYDEAKYPVYRNVYYLQGTHDAATIAAGAWSHWRTVPRKSVFFLLSIKGGHNPGLSKLISDNKEIKEQHQLLYMKAINNEPIDNQFVNTLNTTVFNFEKNEYLKNVTWELFLKIPQDFSSIEGNLEGIRKISR